jgi:hypothetical protein
MHKLIATFATTATIVVAASIVGKAEAVTTTQLGGLSPLTKSYTPIEEVGWRRRYARRAYRRGYYGYGYPYYGYGYYQPYPYYSYGYHRPYPYYGYGYGPGYGWRY